VADDGKARGHNFSANLNPDNFYAIIIVIAIKINEYLISLFLDCNVFMVYINPETRPSDIEKISLEAGKASFAKNRSWRNTPMKFKSEKIDNITIIKIPVDALDAGNIMEFKTDIVPLLKDSKKVLLNMGKVKFMDSSGIGSMLSCLRSVSGGGGELKMFSVQQQLITLFKLVRLDRIIDVYESKKEAIASFVS